MKSILSYQPPKYRLIFLIGIGAMLPSFASADTALDRQKQALDIIADFADRFCKDIPLKGAGDSVELSGQAKAELSGIVAKLVNLGVEGAGKYQNSEYQGLLQKDLIESLKSTIDCRLKIWGDLKSALLSTTPDTVDKPHTDGQYKYKTEKPTYELKATAQATGKQTNTGPEYKFTIFINSPPDVLDTIEKVTYDFNHPTFNKPHQEVTDANTRFETQYVGWGCLDLVDVKIFSKDGTMQKVEFNMCKSLKSKK